MKTFYWVEVNHNDIKLDVCKFRNGNEFIDKGIFLSQPDEMLDLILDSDTCSGIYRNADRLVAKKLKQETPIPFLRVTPCESDAPPI